MRQFSNFAVVLALVILFAMGFDWVTRVLFHGRPFLLCWFISTGHRIALAIGLLMFFGGLVITVAKAGKNAGTGIGLLLGGLLLSVAPELLDAALGASCLP